jgi:S-formylglutathione hydrolase FrmB
VSRALAALVAGAALAALAAPSPARANKLETITIPDRHGEIPSKWLSYPGPPRANVLLPDHYDPSRRYPLLVLLNGLNCNYDWYVQAGLTKEFDGLDAIVVMPEGGSGWYTDWWNDGKRGDPSWESYFLDEVMPTILARYPILPQRRYHALAGTSMGGMGATYLGGRLPGFFGSVASLSGFVDPQYFALITGPAMGLTSEAPLKGNYNVNPVEGPPRGFYMAGHNPTRLARNLKQTRVFVTTGSGGRGGLENGGPVGFGEERVVIYPMNQRYDPALNAAGVDVTYQVHQGGHDIPDFKNEVDAMLAWGIFEPVVAQPRSWVNDTVATSGQLWDIGYRFDQPPGQVVRFERSGDSLSIADAGSAVTITTAAGCVIRTATPATIAVERCRLSR